MPWKKVKPMDEKVLFIADYLRQQGSFSDLCDHYGISHKATNGLLATANKALMDWEEEQSRRPKDCSTVTHPCPGNNRRVA